MSFPIKKMVIFHSYVSLPEGKPNDDCVVIIKGSLGGETSVLRTFRMSGKELVKERVSEGKS